MILLNHKDYIICQRMEMTKRFNSVDGNKSEYFQEYLKTKQNIQKICFGEPIWIWRKI